MNNEFRIAIDALQANQESFEKGMTSSFDHATAREAAICSALRQLARHQGVELEGPHCIDSRGEVQVFAAEVSRGRRGTFGEKFAALLNTVRPRTGMTSGAVMLPESAWCYLNHFDAERLVRHYALEAAEIAA